MFLFYLIEFFFFVWRCALVCINLVEALQSMFPRLSKGCGVDALECNRSISGREETHHEGQQSVRRNFDEDISMPS